MRKNTIRNEIPAPYEVFQGNNTRRPGVVFPPAPPWRRFNDSSRRERGTQYVVSDKEKEAVNAAICLRRPLLVTGRPGTGKSSLARAIAEELELGAELVWSITSRSTLQQGLYEYDGIARVQEAASQLHKSSGNRQAAEAQTIAKFIRLGPLGSALADSTEEKPRVLLVDEIDKSDIDLPNDLLHVFEEGEFIIPELARASNKSGDKVEVALFDYSGHAQIESGRVRCRAFPIVLLTSNGEREFPPAFLRRCLRLDIPRPDRQQLERIVQQRLKIDPQSDKKSKELLDLFTKLQDQEHRELATDQLLNAVHLVCNGHGPMDEGLLRNVILRALSESGS